MSATCDQPRRHAGTAVNDQAVDVRQSGARRSPSEARSPRKGGHGQAALGSLPPYETESSVRLVTAMELASVDI